MPTGKIRFYDPEKGFGFIAGEAGAQVYVHGSLVEDESALVPGTRVEYSVAEAKRGPQALSLRVLEAARPARKQRKSPDDMVVIVEDLVRLLDETGNAYRQGQYPERAHGRKIAQLLRVVADELEA
ncbi:MAG: cold shock domain-containing protein [Microbacteriaceae bacterium]|nr:cold shock domain-containing protein [Microbacteriaceae bacterium]